MKYFVINGQWGYKRAKARTAVFDHIEFCVRNNTKPKMGMRIDQKIHITIQRLSKQEYDRQFKGDDVGGDDE